ncbi:hypothetical protein Tco_1009645 [Tanacetum coccineum]
MIHNELSNSAKIDSLKRWSGFDVVDLTSDEDPTDEDGENDMGDPTEGSMSLGGVGRKKSQGSNSGDGGNPRDGDKTVGGAIGARGGGIGDSLLVASYARMTFINGSSWKGEMVSESEKNLISINLETSRKEVFP